LRSITFSTVESTNTAQRVITIRLSDGQDEATARTRTALVRR
jgi:hypothetical protein